MTTSPMAEAVKLWAERARSALATSQFTAADLDELVALTAAAPPRQHLLYLHAAKPSIRAPIVGYALHEAVAGSVTQVDPLAPPPPYSSVHAAILDGWRVIHFPQQQAPFEDREIDLIGSEFILEKWETSHD